MRNLCGRLPYKGPGFTVTVSFPADSPSVMGQSAGSIKSSTFTEPGCRIRGKEIPAKGSVILIFKRGKCVF